MSDKQFATVAGIVQFEVETREANGKELREATIRAIGSGKMVRITLWDQFEDLEVEKGDFIVADGEAKQNTKDGKTYNNLNAYRVYVAKPFQPKETTRTVNGGDDSDLSSIF